MDLLLHSFQHCGHALTAADAKSGQTEGMPFSHHFIGQGKNEPRAGASDGVADGNAAPQNIGFLHVALELPDARNGLGCKSLIELDGAEVVNGQFFPVKDLSHRRNRTKAINAGSTPPVHRS